MFRCMSSTNCHSLLDVVLASNSLCKACSSLCTTSNNHLQPSFAEARNRSWNAVLTARDGKNQSELKTGNTLPIKPCRNQRRVDLDWHHQPLQVSINHSQKYSTTITICSQALQKPGTDLEMQHHQQEMTKINQSSKQQIHYQSSLAETKEE